MGKERLAMFEAGSFRPKTGPHTDTVTLPLLSLSSTVTEGSEAIVCQILNRLDSAETRIPTLWLALVSAARMEWRVGKLKIQKAQSVPWIIIKEGFSLFPPPLPLFCRKLGENGSGWHHWKPLAARLCYWRSSLSQTHKERDTRSTFLLLFGALDAWISTWEGEAGRVLTKADQGLCFVFHGLVSTGGGLDEGFDSATLSQIQLSVSFRPGQLVW